MARELDSNEISGTTKSRGSSSDKGSNGDEVCVVQAKRGEVAWMEIHLGPGNLSSGAASSQGQKGSSPQKDKLEDSFESPNLPHHVNGTTTFKVEEKTTTVNPLLKSYFNFCGYPFTFKLCSVLMVVMLSMATGFGFAIWKLTDDNRLSPTPTSPSLASTFLPRLPAPLIDTNGNRNGSSTPSPTFSLPQPNGWYIRTRRDWNAWEPEKTIEWLQHPVKNVVIAHTAGGICLTEVACCDKMRGIQEWVVVNRGLDDVPYNFLVGGDGNVYEGLGWDIKGYHSKRYNSVSIGVSFIGNFVFNHPTQQQLEAAKRLLAWGVEIGKLDNDYRLLPHNLTHATVSPGRFIYQEIKNWPHFTEERFYIPS